MNAVSKIKQAGFDVAFDGGRLKVVGASKLTTEQRSFIATNKAELIAELQQADRAIELMASGWALWNAVARCRSESLPDWNWKPTS